MSTNCNFLNYLKASLLNTANHVNYVLVFIHHYIIRFTLSFVTIIIIITIIILRSEKQCN